MLECQWLKKKAMNLPEEVIKVLSILEEASYQSVVVGGAVRDDLLKRPVHDYDIATSASYEQIIRLFGEGKTFTKGIKHDTVIVHMGKRDIEVTSYRGSDPLSLKADLALRDFTIDAMALTPDGIYDPFNGKEDLNKKIIRSVGNALDDFASDSLRILRGLRLSGELGFAIEGKTHDAMKIMAPELKRTASERIGEELKKIIVLKNADEIIRHNKEVFFTILPELKAMDGFNQHSAYHEFDVLEHCLHALFHVTPRTPLMCLSALFHDLGKPQCFFRDEKGEGHFYGHDKLGAKRARKICQRLHYSTDFTEDLCFLVEHHMFQIEKPKTLRRYLGKYGKERMDELFSLREADIRGTVRREIGPIPYVTALRQSMNAIDLKKEGILKNALKINGDDLKSLGFTQGKELGDVLKDLRAKVVDGDLANDHEVLIEEAKKYLKK